MMKKRKILFIFGGIILALAILFEVALRKVWGFCDSPLCMSSDVFEYICKPNQDCYRFRHHIHYNSYSQRRDEPDTSRIIVLGLGDSVINGGVLTDNDSLATTIASDNCVQILNISAGSWGPDNCAAYLREYGTFGAQKFLLVVGSGDAYDNMDFQPVVGIHKSFPSEQYKLAIGELIDRYLIPKIKKNPSLDPDQKALQGVGIRKKGKVFNPGFAQLKLLADSLSVPLSIYLHPDRVEYEERQYNEQGQEIIEWARLNDVPLYKGLDADDFSADCYRDGIHINEKGQKILSRWMMEEVKSLK